MVRQQRQQQQPQQQQQQQQQPQQQQQQRCHFFATFETSFKTCAEPNKLFLKS